MRRGCCVAAMVTMLATGDAGAWASDPFVQPTAAELAMKELPGYPNAAAVVLSREESSIDEQHVTRIHVRIKVLTEEGRSNANVELPYEKVTGNDSWEYDSPKVGEIVGRTIHADGAVVPFTGKPYVKTMESTKHMQRQALVFTLPDVEVGSIVEYSYSVRYEDAFIAPQWYVQGDLYVKSAHYEWYPTSRGSPITCFPVLPPGTKVDRVEKHVPGFLLEKTEAYVLDAKDIPPLADEELEPPVKSYSYRVLFSFSAYKTAADFWKGEGKKWSDWRNQFAEQNGALKAATAAIVAGAATPEQKLRRIYAKVMELENTRYTRQRDEREDKAHGAQIDTVADVLKLRRGTPYQLTELFLGMARAAGLKAYAMDVPDRSVELFTPAWQSFQQFDDLIAIVVLDGKEVYFDPGTRYVPYGHLAWEHTFVGGLRQTEAGTDFGQTPGDLYKDNRVIRSADLTVDEKGAVTGRVQITYTGTPALNWRHIALRGDAASLQHALETSLAKGLPTTLDVKLAKIEALEEYEEPLTVLYDVTGTVGTVTGKRLLLPVDFFQTAAASSFPHETRKYPVYFEYPEAVQDAVQVRFANGLTLEAAPTGGKYTFLNEELYDLNVTTDVMGFKTRRDHIQGESLVPVKDYAQLRQFYGQIESKDKESVVLKQMQ